MIILKKSLIMEKVVFQVMLTREKYLDLKVVVVKQAFY